jgi:hypothetical protein
VIPKILKGAIAMYSEQNDILNEMEIEEMEEVIAPDGGLSRLLTD